MLMPILDDDRLPPHIANPHTADESCPLLVKCVKYRIDESEQHQLAEMINFWESQMPAIQFLKKLGELVATFRLKKS